MSSDEIDMAFYCNHMAVHLVRSNDNFEIYGPVIMNAEVIAYERGKGKVSKLGIGQKREHLKRIAKGGSHQVEEILEMSPISLPYTLETGEIDGAILDISKAALLPKFSFMPLSEDDYISYSLVVRKDIVKTEAFNEFLKSYNKVVEDLNNIEMLKKDIIMPDEFWDKSNIKFLSLE